jgi:hypothetical protein
MEQGTNSPMLGSVDEQPGADERRALLERVAGSIQLKRAARLREFLLYVGNQSLKEGCTDIHEQEIGSEVFGRQASYDTSQDNIVRVNATELRKRIELYFATEGAGETLILEIPRGSYKPVFRRRPAELPPVATELGATTRPVEPPPEQPAPSNKPFIAPSINAPSINTVTSADDAQPRRRSRALIALYAVVFLLAGTCLFLLQQNRTMRKALYAWEGNPALAEFWPAFLHSHLQTDIILADTSVALIEDITRHPISLSDYLNHSYLGLIHSSDLSPDRQADLSLVVSRNNGSVGDFRVAQQILGLDRTASNLHLHFARDYMPDSIKQDNVILIGSRKSNPWVYLFNDQLNFTIEYDPNRVQSFVANRNPHAGEPATYVAPVDPYASVGYSVIAFLPNPSHTGNAIIIAGTDSDATNAAGEFLTSEERLEQLQNLIHVKTLPYFEALLKTTHLSGTPFSAELVAYRTYPGLH